MTAMTWRLYGMGHIVCLAYSMSCKVVSSKTRPPIKTWTMIYDPQCESDHDVDDPL